MLCLWQARQASTSALLPCRRLSSTTMPGRRHHERFTCEPNLVGKTAPAFRASPPVLPRKVQAIDLTCLGLFSLQSSRSSIGAYLPQKDHEYAVIGPLRAFSGTLIGVFMTTREH